MGGQSGQLPTHVLVCQKVFKSAMSTVTVSHIFAVQYLPTHILIPSYAPRCSPSKSSSHKMSKKLNICRILLELVILQ